MATLEVEILYQKLQEFVVLANQLIFEFYESRASCVEWPSRQVKAIYLGVVQSI